MSIKSVVILDETPPVGLKAKFAAVLGMTLGRLMPKLVGVDTPIKDGIALSGIITVALPILGAPSSELSRLFIESDGLPVHLAYMNSAVEARTYDAYATKITPAPFVEHEPQTSFSQDRAGRSTVYAAAWRSCASHADRVRFGRVGKAPARFRSQECLSRA